MNSINDMDEFVKDYKNFEERLSRLYGDKHGYDKPHYDVVALYGIYLKEKRLNKNV